MKTIMIGCAVAVLGACAVDGNVDVSEDVTTSEAEQAATQTDVWRQTWNGGSANAQFWSPTGGGYIDLFENKSNMGQFAYLTVSAWGVDPTSQRCETWEPWPGEVWQWCFYSRSTYTYVWGQIPTGDAAITPGLARVKTTLGAGVAGYQCTYDYDNWANSGCVAPTGGVVDVRWNKNGFTSSFHSGTDQQTFGPYTYKSQGTWRSASADATGTVLGIDFSGGYGYFGDTRGSNVTKSVIQTPKP